MLKEKPFIAPIQSDQLLTQEQAGVYLGGEAKPLSPRTMERMRQSGMGPKFLRVGAKLVRYRQSDLDDYLRECQVQSTSE